MTWLNLNLFLLFLTFVSLQDKKVIFLIGDSTMSIKEQKAYPETGWGMPFVYFFNDQIRIDNRAKNGRSTRTFINEGLWEATEKEFKSGDYLFIQFGHNDESEQKPDRYTSPEDYKKNLELFIRQAKVKRVKPIVLSPVARRRFMNGEVQASHGVYSELARKVAEQEQVIFIDLDVLSQQLLQSLGEENSKLLFLQLKPNEHPNYPEGKDDNTHFNELGARLIAQLVLAELRIQCPELMVFVGK